MKIHVVVVLLALMLSFSAVASQAETTGRWSGTYRRTDGALDLIIDEWEPGQLEVNVVKAGTSLKYEGGIYADNVYGTFLAEITGDLAKWSSISPCPTTLRKIREGIVVVDGCKGAVDASGRYQSVHRK